MSVVLKKVLVYLIFAASFFTIFYIISKVFDFNFSIPKIIGLTILVTITSFVKDWLYAKLSKRK